jgi:hypothetical protein
MPNDTDSQIRKYAQEKFKARSDLRIHALAFLISNPMLVVMWGLTSNLHERPFPWFWIPLIGWAVALLGHYLYYSMKYGNSRDKREQFIAREMERERARIYGTDYPEKYKNDFTQAHRLYLTEDGELSGHLIDDEDDMYAEQRH